MCLKYTWLLLIIIIFDYISLYIERIYLEVLTVHIKTLKKST